MKGLSYHHAAAVTSASMATLLFARGQHLAGALYLLAASLFLAAITHRRTPRRSQP